MVPAWDLTQDEVGERAQTAVLGWRCNCTRSMRRHSSDIEKASLHFCRMANRNETGMATFRIAFSH
jgi:hypothetical protein